VERDNDRDGIDISQIDPDVAELLGFAPTPPIDYPTQSEGPPTEADEAALRGNPHEGGVEDEEFDKQLGKPEELLRKTDPTLLPWVKQNESTED